MSVAKYVVPMFFFSYVDFFSYVHNLTVLTPHSLVAVLFAFPDWLSLLNTQECVWPYLMRYDCLS